MPAAQRLLIDLLSSDRWVQPFPRTRKRPVPLHRMLFDGTQLRQLVMRARMVRPAGKVRPDGITGMPKWRRYPAAQWGRMSAIRPVPVIDGLLAATALSNGLTLVTHNDRDVAGLGATVLNPFESPESRHRP